MSQSIIGKENSLSNFDPFSLRLVSPFSSRLSSFYLKTIISRKKVLEEDIWRGSDSYRLPAYVGYVVEISRALDKIKSQIEKKIYRNASIKQELTHEIDFKNSN